VLASSAGFVDEGTKGTGRTKGKVSGTNGTAVSYAPRAARSWSRGRVMCLRGKRGRPLAFLQALQYPLGPKKVLFLVHPVKAQVTPADQGHGVAWNDLGRPSVFRFFSGLSRSCLAVCRKGKRGQAFYFVVSAFKGSDYAYSWARRETVPFFGPGLVQLDGCRGAI